MESVDNVLGDDDAFDEWFNEVLKDPDDCADLSDINPSKPGWSIRLHFDDDPRKGPKDSQASEDYEQLMELQKIGFFETFIEGAAPLMVLVVKHKEDTGTNEFSKDQLELFHRYRPLAKAPTEARHSSHQTMRPPEEAEPAPTKPRTNVSRGRLDTPEKAIEQAAAQPRKDLQELLHDADIRRNPIFQIPTNRKLYLLDFESIILTLPFSHERQEQIRAKLVQMGEDENLNVETMADEDTGYFDIVIEPKADATYADQHMGVEYVEFIDGIARSDIQVMVL